jgi:hypothetical protein
VLGFPEIKQYTEIDTSADGEEKRVPPRFRWYVCSRTAQDLEGLAQMLLNNTLLYRNFIGMGIPAGSLALAALLFLHELFPVALRGVCGQVPRCTKD